jgi:hypothetical protein
VLALILWRLSLLTENKLSYTKTAEFVETGNEYDVLFFGTSHMTMSIYPMELWKDYGITSYNLGGNGCPLATSYWVMMNALDYSAPQLAVIDCYTLQRDAKVPKESGYLHEFLDALPLSKNKYRAVCDLYDDNADRMEYLWDFSTYHYRWSELKKDDLRPQYGVDKGADYTDVVAVPNKVEQVDTQQVPEITSVGAAYLEKMIEECQKRNIQVLLTYMPYPAPENDQMAAGYVKTIAAKYGVDYINFLETDVIDYAVDCYDENSHLNASGARKVTQYLGDYIQAEYDIPDHRGASQYAAWDEDYAEYMAYKAEKLQEKESLKNYLMLLADKNFSCCIYVKKNSTIWDNDERYEKLFYNLMFGDSPEGLSTAVEQGETYFVAVDNDAGNVTECVGEGTLEETASFGKIAYSAGNNGISLYVGEDETNYLEGDEVPDVQILVFDNTNGNLIDVAQFDVSAVKNSEE